MGEWTENDEARAALVADIACEVSENEDLVAMVLAAYDERRGDVLTSLQHAVKIIKEHVPRDALGMNAQGDPDVPGGFQQWPLLDEYLHYMEVSIAKALGDSPSPPPADEQGGGG